MSTRLSRSPLWIAAFALMCAQLLLTPSAHADGGGVVLSNASVTPTDLPSSGGTITISVDVTTGSLIQQAYGHVTMNGSTVQDVLLLQTAVDGSGIGGTWSGDYDVPANTTVDTQQYGVTVEVQDTGGGVATAIAGTVTVAGLTPPVIGAAGVTPPSLSSAGGEVTITATVTDDQGVSQVWADITGGPSDQDVPLTADPENPDHYSATATLPANGSDQDIAYQVDVGTYDVTHIRSDLHAGSVVVATTPAPGRLTVTPDRFFGGVRIGRSAVRWITVSNRSAATSSAVVGRIPTIAQPFGLRTDGRQPRFTLEPGQSITFAVVFRPTQRGRYAGAVSIIRADGRQPTLAVEVHGRGVLRTQS